MSRLRALLDDGPYHSYAYGYPHKTAYRPFDSPIPLRDAWAGEPRERLFLYVHVPFCEQRCGFCNLYTVAQPDPAVVDRYVGALEAQADAVASAIGPATWARLALGGGTPTWLPPGALGRVFRLAQRFTGRVPTSVETSPATLSDAHLDVLVDAGTTRVSVGVQSVDTAEAASVVRAQSTAAVESALRRLRDRVPVVNADLIYGLGGQTAETLADSIRRVIDWGANELYLYPLYVRPETSLGRRTARQWADERLALYRAGRALLLAMGWTQLTMRCFRSPGETQVEPPYRCQEDGMVGLGAGARSYTRSLHWAHPFAVRQSKVRVGVDAWVGQDPGFVHHGIHLDRGEQQRRWVLLSLLEAGLDRAGYRARFGTEVLDDLPELAEAVDVGLLTAELVLTESGRENSDVLGAWLQSDRVRAGRAAWVEP